MHKDHWKSPRKTIATKFEHNDYGYVFHAGILLKEFLLKLDYPVNELKTKRILDYGCGTGRVTRFLSLFAKEAVGYDPTVECIVEGTVEQEYISDAVKKHPILTHLYDEINGLFDLVVCINVLEHLDVTDFDIAMSRITEKLTESGECYIWVHQHKNDYFFAEHNLEPVVGGNIKVVKGTKVDGKLVF